MFNSRTIKIVYIQKYKCAFHTVHTVHIMIMYIVLHIKWKMRLKFISTYYFHNELYFLSPLLFAMHTFNFKRYMLCITMANRSKAKRTIYLSKYGTSQWIFMKPKQKQHKGNSQRDNRTLSTVLIMMKWNICMQKQWHRWMWAWNSIWTRAWFWMRKKKPRHLYCDQNDMEQHIHNLI